MKTLQILNSVSLLGEFQEISDFKSEYFSHLGRASEEELLPCVDVIDPPALEMAVQLVFEGYGVFREKQAVYIKPKWDGRVAQFIYSIHRFQAAG